VQNNQRLMLKQSWQQQ